MMFLSILLAAVIGVSDQCPTEQDGRNVRVRANYCAAIAKSGHVPFVISRFGDDAQLDEVVSRIDALVLSGGEDVEPKRYGEKHHPKLGKVNLGRDDFEFRLLAAARRRGIPILGICRGCQLLNVAFGGTLYQDIPSYFPESTLTHSGKRHSIKIVPGSRLAELLGKTEVEVNSHHHQCVKAVAPGFRVVATACDGVVEAIESESEPVMGVQFHPEGMIHDAGDMSFVPIFKELPGWRKPGACRTATTRCTSRSSD